MKKALVVLSGGQDSTTALYWAINKYGHHNVATISFDYGQRHSIELNSAMTIAKMADVPHEEIHLGMILRGTSPLTDPKQALETYDNYAEMDKIIGDRIEKTFVPMRNALFLTVAANRAVVAGFNRIVTGVCQQDNANYPDCRSDFILAQELTINSALGRDDIQIRAPLMFLSKAQSIRLAMSFPGCMAALAYSHTAYDGRYPPTSKDHASILRAQGFAEAGVPDPLVVRAIREGRMPVPDSPNYKGFKGDSGAP